MLAGVDGPPFFGSSSIDEWSHIPLPCGAALLLLPLGTGHETYITFTTFCTYQKKKKKTCQFKRFQKENAHLTIFVPK